ncbi:MAG TPA: membrane dipeptidase [Chthoniobacteraceae bacterium]|nr:membrane dipeptidase [Chthoniobacteraceae bacterium]
MIQIGNPATSTIEEIRKSWEAGLAVLKPSAAQLEKGLALHREALVLDTFGFLPMAWNEEATHLWNTLHDANVGAERFAFEGTLIRALAPTYNEASAREILEAIAVSGVNGMFHTAGEGKSHEEDIRRIAASIHLCGSFGDALRQVRQPDDLRRAWRNGSFSVALSVNGPPCAGHLNSLEEEIAWLPTWYHLGVRMMHLSYNRRNVVATGCAERNDGGLSELGYEFIEAMNRTGIIVDVPHSSEKSSMQAAETTRKPMMASHVCCKAVFDHMRNKSDEVLKAIAGTGGLVGMVARPAFLGPNSTVATLLDHIDYAVRLIGADHVAVGSDTAYIPRYAPDAKPRPKGAYSSKWWGAWHRQVRHNATASEDHRYGSLAWTNWPLITVGLVMRGHSEAAIRKILGLNLLRVLEANTPDSVLPGQPEEG